jgi:hypothetical protein
VLAQAAALLLLAGGPVSDLQRGAELFDQYKYAEARAAFAKALKAPNLKRGDLLDLLEMMGVAAAQQRQVDAAQTAFIELLTLDPEHKLKNDYAPRVMTPFLEARRIVGEKGALEAQASPVFGPDRVDSITISVTKDPLQKVRSVRFHLLVGSRWTAVSAPLAAATFDVKQPEAKWWAELLGERDAQLVVLGTADAPRLEAAPKPAPAEPVAVAAPPAAVQLESHPSSSSSGGGLRTASYAVLAVAVLAGGAGAFFGVRANNDYAQITGAQKDSAGVLLISEHDANVFESAGHTSALAANSLFIGAGVLAVAAVLMWILGAP